MRHFAKIFLSSAALVLAASPAFAEFPERPVTMIVGFAPGGGTDYLARVMADELSTRWGKPVIVENRPGGDGSIASNLVANAPADGYTLVLATTNLVIPAAGAERSYDPVKSFAAVARVAEIANVFVINPKALQVDTLAQFVALAKAKPGALQFASSGPNSAPAMTMNLFMKMAGIEMLNVSYKGNGPGVVALLANEVQSTFSALPAVSGQIQAGELRALAISSSERHPSLPDVPTVAEAASLDGYEAGTWYGILAPAGTASNVVDKINADVNALLEEISVKEKISKQGFTATPMSPSEFGDRIAGDLEKYSELVNQLK